MAFNTNSDFMQHMGDTFRHVAVPALALGAGTGALSGLMSSKAREGETGRDRRRRVLKNAILGAALGTTAGVGIPMGWEALNTPMHTNTAGPIENAADKATGFAMRHPMPLAAAGGALWANKHFGQRNEVKATDALRSTLKKTDYAKYSDEPTGRMATRQLAGSNPGELLRQYQAGMQAGKPGVGATGDISHLFRGNELMQEAGHKGLSLADMKQMFETGVRGATGEAKRLIPETSIREGFLKHIGDSGMLGSGLANMAGKGRLPFAEQIAKIPGLAGAATYDPIHLSEAYSKYVRPSVGETTQRWLPAPVRWGLLGAGVLGANELQNRLTGS